MINQFNQEFQYMDFFKLFIFITSLQLRKSNKKQTKTCAWKQGYFQITEKLSLKKNNNKKLINKTVFRGV